ncbi:WD40-repeat-containing domain protein, partial [Lipomyces oligophaga]|uniref:WD40-repeat-containing domain protein n=1 Tax=Lipomyces oligophaga TaxID=45792 RepID=UPI0034CEAD31
MQNSDDEADELRRFLPAGFGKQTAKHDPEPFLKKCLRKDYIERINKETEKNSGDDSSSDDELEDLPISHDLLLKEHNKIISALAIDSSGVRLATGSHDFNLDIWDFSGMNPLHLRPFRSLEPTESHLVRALDFYPGSGDLLLTATTSSQAKLYTRDGIEMGECVRGDMYIRDLNNTSGHLAEITAASFHPSSSAERFATGSVDGTIRIWDVNKYRRTQDHVIIVKPSRLNPRVKPRVSSMSWRPVDGKYIAGVSTDGSLSYWSASGPYSRPVASIPDAHVAESWTSSVLYADENTIVTRGSDLSGGCVKLWDVRSFKSPVLIRSGLLNSIPETNIDLSPDGRYLVTGTSSFDSSSKGHVHILDKSDLSTVTQLALDDSTQFGDAEQKQPSASLSPVTVKWSSTLNQIIVGSTTGSVHVFFSRGVSRRGAISVLEKPPKVRHIDDDITADIDLVAASVGQEGQQSSGASRRKTQAKLQNPEMPVARRMHGEVRVVDYDEPEVKQKKRRIL